MPREVVYVSRCMVERRRGPVRHAQIPGEAHAVVFSVHGAIAKHYYGVNAGALGEPHASTIDYLVASVGGWMLGTFGSALEARQIKADGKLVAEVRGEVEEDSDKVLIIRRIHVELRLRAPEAQRQAAERVHGMYVMRCPLYRSVMDAIALTSTLIFVPEGDHDH